MAHCIFDRTTKQFLGGARYDVVPFDPATQIDVVLVDFPDVRLQRWDDASDVRPATAPEIAAYDAARLDAQAAPTIDRPELRAVVRALLDEIDLRFPANKVDRPAFRQRAIGYLKALL